MNPYQQLRRHWSHLPELPDPDSVDVSAWSPEDPEALKRSIQDASAWGYVDHRLRDRLDALIEAARRQALDGDPAGAVDLSRGTISERWAAMPASWTMQEKLEADIAAYNRLQGPVCRVASGPGQSLVLAWEAVDGWVAARYQPMGRSIDTWGRDTPVKDDPFGTWLQDGDGKWQHQGVRQSWVSLGGYDPARGPWRGACGHYPVAHSWLESSGAGPWQLAVAAHFDGRGWVFGPVIEWPVEAGQGVQIAPSRMDRIVLHTESFDGRRTRDGRPYVRQLRRHAEMPDITGSERDEAHRRQHGNP